LEASIARALDTSRPAFLYNEPTLPRESFDLEGVRFVGMDNGPVPDFSVESYDGTAFESDGLVGQEPFIVVFFATWCQVCDLKMPVLRNVLQALGPVKTIMVSVDDAETWPHVTGYLREHQVQSPVVSAQAYPRFFASYNPFQAVPLVVVVGKNGGLVDYQMGFSETHQERLTNAIRLARSVGPLKTSKADSVPSTQRTPAAAKQAPHP
jgi:thiol-disulfide isomerase/thioredoxin